MKKIYVIALMAMTGVTMANAQALKLENNFVMKTCALLPEGTEPIITQQEVDGEMKDVVKCPQESKINGIADKVANAFIDDDFNALPLSGGTANGINYHVLEQDYTDPETGISFKAGTYSCLNSNTAINLYDSYNRRECQTSDRLFSTWLLTDNSSSTHVSTRAPTRVMTITISKVTRPTANSAAIKRRASARLVRTPHSGMNCISKNL